MLSASTIRLQIESKLAHRIPAALTPSQRILRPVAPTGVPEVDELLDGGLPIGEITEMVGAESSGLTSLALSCVSRSTQEGRVCAWIDGNDALHVESAAAAGVDLPRLLWVRCGVRAEAIQIAQKSRLCVRGAKPWARIEQALAATDLLLQGGGFSIIVLDMGGIPPEYLSRIELSIWFRYRAAVERTQASLVLLTQYPCAKSAGALLLRLHPGSALFNEKTVFTGIEHHLEIERRRFAANVSNVIPLRKVPQRENSAHWQSQPAWAGAR
jgi:hypothetical protein